ncbi:MAG: mercury transporter MerT [Candidatus Paracaedimonas acanthamoebae]|uniref:Mercuric transport protein MerT n=1 Tax=Candidatus Paracaedimonas acanthamoebae TaxID=244581 RepID=A0A8J7PTL3_9PROT|nr:mercury transporter MerT [Candidatus Paracaedimonas acanthamoebae]
MHSKSTWAAFISTLGSSFLASLCCIGPLLAVVLGVGGAWASYSAFFAPYRPYMITLMGLSLCYSFYTLYLKSPACEVENGCVHSRALSIQRLIFWIIAALSIALIALP